MPGAWETGFLVLLTGALVVPMAIALYDVWRDVRATRRMNYHQANEIAALKGRVAKLQLALDVAHELLAIESSDYAASRSDYARAREDAAVAYLDSIPVLDREPRS
jgi:hypothetical protein